MAKVRQAPPSRVLTDASLSCRACACPTYAALAPVVYGRIQAPGTEEEALWEDLAKRSESLGSFAPLIASDVSRWYVTEENLIKVARQQCYNYLLIVRMYPSTGSADIALLDVGSGGVMATAQAVAKNGGQNGFRGR